jgi:hypothetical protein
MAVEPTSEKNKRNKVDRKTSEDLGYRGEDEGSKGNT